MKTKKTITDSTVDPDILAYSSSVIKPCVFNSFM